MAAQAQVNNVGLTLTPVQGTVVAAVDAASSANMQASTAQAQMAEVGATLTPQQETVVAAQEQVNNVGLTLTPVQGTVVAAENAANSANIQVGTAQAQINSVGATLTPQQATVIAAQEQVNNVGLTLTPVQGTVSAAESAASSANMQASTAQAQIESIGATLTPQQGTIVAAQDAANTANFLAATAQAQVDTVGLTLTPQQATVVAAEQQVNNVGLTLTPVQGTVIAAQEQVNNVGLTLTPQQVTIAAAQAQVESIGATLTPQQATIVAAQFAANAANFLAATAQAQVDTVGLTLTPQQATVVAAEQQVNNVGMTLTPVQGTVIAAQEQVNNVGMTLTPQQGTIAAAQQQVNNVGLTLTPVQGTVAAAQAQVANVGLTLTPVQGTVVAASNNASSIALSVSAQEAISNDNYDLALALVLESIRLNPGLTQPQRLLNQIAYGSPRLSVDQTQAVAFSPNNRFLAAGQGADVVVWDLQTRQVIDTLRGHSGTVLDLAFDPTGQLLATGGQDAQAILWNVSPWLSGGTATISHQLSGHSGPVNAVAFKPDGSILLTGSEDTRIIGWDVRGGGQVQTYQSSWPVQKLAYAENPRYFFAWTNAGAQQIFAVWDTVSVRATSSEGIVPEVLSSNKRYALTGGDNSSLKVILANGLSVQREFTRGFNWGADSLSGADFVGQTGSQVLVGLNNSNNENRLVLADIGSGEILRSFEGEGARRVNAVAVSPDGTLALTGFGSKLVLWDVQRGVALRTLAAHNDLVDWIRFSPDGRYALSHSGDNNVRIWDVTGGDSAELLRVKAETQIATANFPGFNPLRDAVYAGVWIDMFEWSGTTGQQTGRVSVGAPIVNMVYNPAKPQAVTILDNVAILWNLDAGTNGLVNRFANTDDHMNGAGAFSPNGEWLVLDGRSQIYVYNMETQRRTVNINKPGLPQGFRDYGSGCLAGWQPGGGLQRRSDGAGKHAR